jgi:hypothetical protein
MAEEAESTVSSSPSARGGLVMKEGKQTTGEDVRTTIAAIAATILTVVTLGVAVFCWWMRGLASSISEEEVAREEAEAWRERLTAKA